MTGRSKTEVDRIKNDITTVVDSRRPLFKNSGKDRPRWYDVVSTTNRDRYNLEAENRKDRGIEVRIINNDLFIKLYARMYESIVWLVKRGKLDAIPDPRLDKEARTEARKRIFKSDLMDILECAFAFTHIPVVEHQAGDQKVETLKKVIDKIAVQPADYDGKDSDEKPNIALVATHKEQKSRLMRRWRLSYTDKNDGKRVYMTHRSGLMQFAEDYKWFYHKSNIIVKNDLGADAIDKLTIEISDSLRYSWSEMDRKTTERAVMFRETIRDHFFEVENGDILSVERKANEYLKANEDFINAAIHGKWLISM
jgi:hypothetical protein